MSQNIDHIIDEMFGSSNATDEKFQRRKEYLKRNYRYNKRG